VAASLAIHLRPSPAAAVLLSGRVADEAPPVAGEVTTQILIGHGDADPVMPVALAEPGAQHLVAWGAKVRTRIFPGLGHEVGAAEVAEVQEFLAAALR
jgi:phospholipase/carboxylesterase